MYSCGGIITNVRYKMCSLTSAKNLGFWEIFDQKRFYSSSDIWQACIFDVNGADGVFGWALLYPGHQPEPHYVHGRAHIFPIHGQKLGLDNEMKWLTGLLFGIFNRCLLRLKCTLCWHASALSNLQQKGWIISIMGEVLFYLAP